MYKENLIKNLTKLLTEQFGNTYQGLLSCKLPKNTISNIKSGSAPSIFKIAQLADTLHVSIDDLLERPHHDLPIEQQALLETYLHCDEQAKADILNYIEYQAEQSKRRSEIADNAINQNKRFGE